VAFAALVARHERAVWATTWRVLRDDHAAADAGQEAFLQAFRQLADLRQPEQFGPWLLRIARRVSIRMAGRRAREPSRSLDDVGVDPPQKGERLESTATGLSCDAEELLLALPESDASHMPGEPGRLDDLPGQARVPLSAVYWDETHRDARGVQQEVSTWAVVPVPPDRPPTTWEDVAARARRDLLVMGVGGTGWLMGVAAETKAEGQKITARRAGLSTGARKDYGMGGQMTEGSTQHCMEVIMRLMSGMILVLAGLGAALSRLDRTDADVPIRRAAYQHGLGPMGFTVRWIGQDGQDYVSPNNRLEPSEVQDIHLVLAGLDPRREVVFVDVTGLGGDQWQYNAQSSSWKAELKRRRGSTTADLFIEPGRVETGRPFHVLVRYDDGSTLEADLRSRRTDPFLRMPAAALQARWIGQGGEDWTGTGPSVGPDGLQDARIHLTRLGVKVPIQSIRIERATGRTWEFGANPQLNSNAELVRDAKDPSQGDLFFQPDRDLTGQRLRLTVFYQNEKRDGVILAAGRVDPALQVPQAPLPRIEESAITARWLGQDGAGGSRLGDVHVVLSGLSPAVPLAAVIVSDSVRGTWVHRDGAPGPLPADSPAEPMDLKLSPDRKSADLFFPPYRDSTGDTFTVRLVAADGRMSFARFPGGPSDPGLRAAKPAPTRIDAKPGDDLQALVDRYGSVALSPGTYRLTHTLVLNRPVTLTSQEGATLIFAQDPSDPAWTAEITGHCGNTTL
jgi:hypothetical protein